MSFQSIPPDMVDQLHESGPIYVFEKGALHLPGSKSRSRKDDSSKRLRPVSPNVPNYHQLLQDNGQFNVSSLLRICIEYVAKNITIVESLVGFPDIIGIEIFKSVCKQGHLEHYKSERATTIFKLFTNSYQEAVVTDLDLSVFPRLMLEDCLDLVCTFVFLNKLDVADQQLGDEHRLWTAVGEMENLSHLSLKNNLLSNQGLQHMTMPCRMFSRGPIHLQVLNLACNPAITDDGVRYLRCFQMIEDLDLSGTGIKSSGIQRLEQECSLTQLPTENAKTMMFSLRSNSGWAGEVIKGWVKTYRETTTESPGPVLNITTSPLISASNFYNRRRSSLQLTRGVETFPRTPCPSPEPCLRLSASRTREIPSTNSSAENPVKPPRFSMNSQSYKKVNSTSEVMNLCTTRKDNVENVPPQTISCGLVSPSLSNDIVSLYAADTSHICSGDSQTNGKHSTKGTGSTDPFIKKKLSDPCKKSSKFSLDAELPGSSEWRDKNDTNLLSGYQSNKASPTGKSLWSAMHSNHW